MLADFSMISKTTHQSGVYHFNFNGWTEKPENRQAVKAQSKFWPQVIQRSTASNLWVQSLNSSFTLLFFCVCMKRWRCLICGLSNDSKIFQPYCYSSLFLSRLQFEARKLVWKDIKAEKYSRRSTARDFPSAAVPKGLQVQLNRCVWLCEKSNRVPVVRWKWSNKACVGRSKGKRCLV